MNAWLTLTAAGVAGALLGLVFFWGLLATVRRLDKARHPSVLMLGSMILRFAVVLVGFFFLARYGSWQHVLVAAAGFTVPRLLMTSRLTNTQPKETSNS